MIQRSQYDAASEAAFQRDLVALIPQMRAFARSLARDAALADDLAQDALAKAWGNRTSFSAGTNLKAWTFMILRNIFYSDARRAWRSTSLDPEVAANTLLANDDATASLDLEDLRQALHHLPPTQREALILVGAGGLSYEEVAEICGCPVGTIKSRVSRGRASLEALLESGAFPREPASAADSAGALMQEVEVLRRGVPKMS